MRVPVIDWNGKPLMPTKPSRARRWIKEGKAIGKWSKLNVFYVQLLKSPSDTKTQEIVVGIDPWQNVYRHGCAEQTRHIINCSH